jgi:hypothetical protein
MFDRCLVQHGGVALMGVVHADARGASCALLICAVIVGLDGGCVHNSTASRKTQSTTPRVSKCEGISKSNKKKNKKRTFPSHDTGGHGRSHARSGTQQLPFVQQQHLSRVVYVEHGTKEIRTQRKQR